MNFFLIEPSRSAGLVGQVVGVSPQLLASPVGFELREMLSHARAKAIPSEAVSQQAVPRQIWRLPTDAADQTADRDLVVGEDLAMSAFPVSATLYRKRAIVYPKRGWTLSRFPTRFDVLSARFKHISADSLWAALRFEPNPVDKAAFRSLFGKAKWWRKSEKTLTRLFGDPPSTFFFGQLRAQGGPGQERLLLAARLSGLVTTSGRFLRNDEVAAVQKAQRAEAVEQNAYRYKTCFHKLFDVGAA